MALAKDKEMFREWRELRAKWEQGEIVLAESPEQYQASAREAIPRVVRQKAEKQYAGSAGTTLLVCANTALSAEEMARLTEPWKDRFKAIYLIAGIDIVRAWPTPSIILRGSWPFERAG